VPESSTPPERRPPVVRQGFAIIWMAIRCEPIPFAIASAGAVVYAAMTVAAAVVLGQVTDRVILPAFAAGETTAGALALTAAAIVAVGTVKASGIAVRRIGATYMQIRLHARFRQQVTSQYQRLPMAWHHRHPTGQLLSNANADVEAAFWPIAPLPFSIGVVVLLVVTAVALVVTDLFLAAVGFLVGPAIGVANWLYNRRMEGPARRAQEMRAAVSGVAHESFEAALVVKTLGREEAETKRFQIESERLRDELIHLGRLRAVFDPAMEALPQLAVLLVLAVGTWRVATGDLVTGTLVQFAYLFTIVAFPIRVIGWLLSDLPRSVVGWERVERVLRARDALPYGSRPAGRVTGPAAVGMRDVWFGYADGDRTTRVLRGIGFDTVAGRTIAVVGPTGSGKSTIASLLVRLADPDHGTVHLDGADVRELAPGALPSSTAIVFQTSFLFDDTIRENITLGYPFTDDAVREACALAQARAFVEALPHGYDTMVGERGLSLSGGQRQRVALARALIRKPRVLVLDDATSSVDPAVEGAIVRGLKSAALPSTVILIAYRPATIAMADEALFVEDGRVRARGTHGELLGSVPDYGRLLTAYERVDTAVQGEPT
jgi:ATP-binding cassette, subfamily B, bacterial